MGRVTYSKNWVVSHEAWELAWHLMGAGHLVFLLQLSHCYPPTLSRVKFCCVKFLKEMYLVAGILYPQNC